MREQPGPRCLYGEELRRALQGQAAEKGRIHRQAGGQRAVNARRPARTIIIDVKRPMSGLRGVGRRFVTGRDACRSRLRCGSTHAFVALRERAIGRAGDGKGENDKTGDQRAHVSLVTENHGI